MSAEFVGIIATTLFGSAGLAALFTSAAPLTRPARLRHRIEKDAALAKTFPEGSESRRALEWSCADAAHQLAAAQLYPTPYKYRYFPVGYGLFGFLVAIAVVARSRTDSELIPDEAMLLMLSVSVGYVAAAVAVHRKTVGRWRLYALLSIEHELKQGTEPSGWRPRDYKGWQYKVSELSSEFNTRANRTPEGGRAVTMASTEEGEAR